MADDNNLTPATDAINMNPVGEGGGVVDGLPRINSSRFQVDRVQSINEEKGGGGPSMPGPTSEPVPTSAENTAAEPPTQPPSENGGSNNNNNVNKTGRFQISNPHGPSSSTATAPTPPAASLSPNDEESGGDGGTISSGRAVHFNVADDSVHAGGLVGGSDRQSSQSTSGYTTQNVKSFRHVETVERVPNINHYRNIMSIEGAMASRPTLDQLHGDTALLEMNETEKSDPIGSEQPLVSPFVTGADGGIVGGDVGGGVRGGGFPGSGGLNAPSSSSKPAAGPKFGWIQGVLVRCMLNILGVMLYLRITWLTGQAGIGLGTLIVLLSAVVTTITTISMCAISTNGEIRGGGAYFMISRSLGPEFGGSIGLIVFFANAVGAAMYVVGFSETLRDTLIEHTQFRFTDGDMNDVRAIGSVTAVILIGICLIGTGFESKMQLGLLAVLLVSIVNYVIGTFMPPTAEKQAKGFIGYNTGSFMDNFVPDWRDNYGFFGVFSIFFPAATGIMAGANISGDLANPQEAIPKGTFLAIFITAIIYIGAIWMSGSTCVRYAPGLVSDVFNQTTVQTWQIKGTIEDACRNRTCSYGLHKTYAMMEIQSAWGWLIIAGIVAASLSSALASFVSAPKVFQAVCKDRLFPYIHVFAKGYGKGDEPRRAYILTFAIALAMILIGDLNAIAPIISNFFLASYALINYAVFDASLATSPGFRPGFKYYNKWLSLAGAVMCIGVMFVISWWTALLTATLIAFLYIYVHHKKPDVNWGSSTQAHSYKSALQSMLKLAATEEHVKNYRPQVLVTCLVLSYKTCGRLPESNAPTARTSPKLFAWLDKSVSSCWGWGWGDRSVIGHGKVLTGNPVARPSLVDFVSNITKDNSLLICGHVVQLQPTDKIFASMRKLSFQLSGWLEKRKVKAFYVPVASPTLRGGVTSLLQLSGMGKLRPNILMLGFKLNWRSSTPAQVNDYVGIIHDAFDSNLGVGVLRLSTGLDYSELMKEYNVGDTQNLKLPEAHAILENVTSDPVYRYGSAALVGSSSSQSTSPSRRPARQPSSSTTTAPPPVSSNPNGGVKQQNDYQSTAANAASKKMSYYSQPFTESEKKTLGINALSDCYSSRPQFQNAWSLARIRCSSGEN